MKNLPTIISRFSLGVVLLFMLITFTACDPFEIYWGDSYDREEDSRLGYMISRRWFGDLGVLIDEEPVRGSVLSFVADDAYYLSGWGTEQDYYGRTGTMIYSQRFEWSLRNGVLYLYYDDPAMDCTITRCRVSVDYFNGYIDGYYFELADYDRYWYDYGYDFPYYYAKAHSDTLTNTSAEAHVCPIVTRNVSRMKRNVDFR